MQESEKSDTLERKVICYEQSAVTLFIGSNMESETIPVTKDSVVGTESGGVGVVVVAAVVEVDVSEKENVTYNHVFLHP